MSILDGTGREIERTEERTFSAGRLDSGDIEIFRDDLCQLLLDQITPGQSGLEHPGGHVEMLYGDSIASIQQQADDVAVTFRGGTTRYVDVVVGADGVYSNVRKQVFGDDASHLLSLGVVKALFTTPNLIDLRNWQLGHREEGDWVIYPNFDQTELRVGVGFPCLDGGTDRNEIAAQKAQVMAACRHLGGDMPRLLDAMQDTPQFYYGELAQVRMPSWPRGRVVLAGDAAHCASPFSGQGTSVALVGALVLAKALAQHADDAARVFAVYEQRMRPFVDLNQALVDMQRRGPAPDDQLAAAKNGIVIDDLL